MFSLFSLFIQTTPHGYCLAWQSGLVWLHVISDALIALAYSTIPLIIYIFLRHKEQQLLHRHLFWLFASFIMACAITHIMGVVVIWLPYYGLQGAIMAITACISLVTVIQLARQMPQLLKMPTLKQMQDLNAQLLEQIAQREQLEKQLRLTQFSVDVASEGIFWINPDASIEYTNDAVNQLLGYELKEIMRLKITDISPLHQQTWAEHWQTLKTQKTLQFEVPVLKKDGTLILLEVRANFIVFEEREYNCAFIHDITERKAIEDSLKANELILTQAQEIAHVGHWQLTFFDHSLRWSDEVYRIFGMIPQQIPASYALFLEHVYPHDRAFVDESYAAHLKSQADYNIIHRIVHENGSIRYVNEKCKTTFDLQGNPIQSIGVVLDITERKQVEQALDDSLDLNQKIISQSAVGVKVFNASGKCIECNEAAAKILAKSVSEILKENMYSVDFWDGDLLNTAITCLLTKSPRRKEIQCVLHNGQKAWLDYNFATFRSSGEIHLLALIYDVSEYRLAQIALQEAELKAVQANEAKSEFIANMSHEIRTPMNAILGFSSILADLLVDSTHKYYLDAIQRSGKTLLQLINDILDLSKIEAGKLTLRYIPVELSALLEDISLIFSQKAQDKSLDFSVSFAENVPNCLMLDDIRLRQILLNLVGNAVKFTQHGFVKIKINARPLPDSAKIDLDIHVCDSGIGIAADQQEKIFAAFTQQAHQDVAYGGTGLGLTICKRLLELMDGHISVQSEQGKGSCFTLTLHTVERVDNTTLSMLKSYPLPTEIFQFKPTDVLLVDDIPFNRLLVKSYLAEFPQLQITEAENGEQALALLETRPFELILMDRRMPGEDGDEICRKIRMLSQYAKTPIVMISASVLTTSEQQFPVAFDVHLTKPLQKNQLIDVLKQFIPFESKTPSPETNFSLAVDVQETLPLLNPEQLISLLKTDYLNTIATWQNSGVLDVEQMIEIGEKLRELADKHLCTALQQWATKLIADAERFDVVNISNTLGDFYKIINQLEHSV